MMSSMMKMAISSDTRDQVKLDVEEDFKAHKRDVENKKLKANVLKAKLVLMREDLTKKELGSVIS